ncbi:BTAD domain-containing putative transcriptional regulator [Micromonospora sp. NPDC047793]|uniref:BTAD domain-containing putative transcriptional regulator n=1 Tax=Micromonospora sp. NPDC047793 TaxID=3154342 RepID=UPI0033F74DF8
MAKRASTAVVRAGTTVLALAPPLLLYPGGWPAADSVSIGQLRAWAHEPLTPGFLLTLGQAGAWLLWTFLVAAITDHVYRHLTARVRWRLQLRLPGPLQALSAALMGTTAVTTAALPATAQDRTTTDAERSPVTPRGADEETPANMAQTQEPQAVVATLSKTPDTSTANVRPAVSPTRDRDSIDAVRSHHGAPEMTVRVVTGDNLWGLAAEHLGHAGRWQEIYKLNRGHRQTNGYSLTDPDVIHVGWSLALPTDQDPTRDTPAPDTPAAPPTSTPETPEPHPPLPCTSTPSTSDEPAEPGIPAPDTDRPHDQRDNATGIALPSQGWISLGLAAAIASVAALLHLQRRRHARLFAPAPVSTAPQPTPLPPSLASTNTTAIRHLDPSSPATTATPAPIGIDTDAAEISLFHLPGPGITLHGPGAIPAARAILAAALTTNATETAALRPEVITTTDLLTQLLPEGAPTVGLDPDGTAYDGERLIVLADTAAAITHAEEEMIGRRRLLDTFDAETITDLNTRIDHAETQPPYVLLIESSRRHAARLEAVAAHHSALDLHAVILGDHDAIPTVEVTAEGTVTSDTPYPVAQLSTLGADDLTAVLAMLTDTLARPEAGTDVDDPPTEAPPAAAPTKAAEPVPAQPGDTAALVRLQVLGPVTVSTAAGPIATGMRSGSYTMLAVLAAHPTGRTLDQLAAGLHPNVDPTAAVKRVRTDITSARRVLRTATGHDEPMFIVYDPATSRYQLDPQTVTVDLWQMLTAIDQATTTDDEAAMLTALRRATELYGGDFAESHDHTWATDYATTYRHQILTAYARIAEILEPDHPDQAVAALERAADLDPVNEELYQRIMRIHGRQQRPDAVRRTLRRLENRLADLGDAEPSQATRRVAERQLRPVAPAGGGRP